MVMTAADKYEKLITYLKTLDRVLLAFSGGVDSSLLLKASREALGEKVTAVTVAAPYIHSWETEEARKTAAQLGVKQVTIEIPLPGEIRNNPANRCYICKRNIFRMLKEMAVKEDYKYLIEGTNFDDLQEHRPGLRALKEMEIISPLAEVQMTKEEIRTLAKELELGNWDKAANTCLLTRIPHDTEINPEDLKKIEQAEKILLELGFKGARARYHTGLVRIEVDKKERLRLLQEEILDEIAGKIKKLGVKYITLDIEGYRKGIFDEIT